jgi:Domain of unknown function (DUF4192)
MSQCAPDVVRLSSPADVICAIPALLGFVPSRSVVVLCLHGERRRVGLVMRFDLADAADPARFADLVAARATRESAEQLLVVVLDDRPPRGVRLPHARLAAELAARLGAMLSDVVLAVGRRWWSYGDVAAGGGSPRAGEIDPGTPGAIAVAAAYALAGQAVLPDRASVVRSVSVGLTDADAERARARVERCLRRLERVVQQERVLMVRRLVGQLSARLRQPRSTLSDADVALFAALCHDVVVRDEVLAGAAPAARRRLLMPVLREVARRMPAPYDPPVCTMLGWLAYADGDGVVAAVALERALAGDPTYSLARLTLDALESQLPPRLLEEVMNAAARDLGARRPAD